jgi:nitrate reductase beta subunit
MERDHLLLLPLSRIVVLKMLVNYTVAIPLGSDYRRLIWKLYPLVKTAKWIVR